MATASAPAAECISCYICYDEESLQAPFCKPPPCHCKGSIQIHLSCLYKIQQSATVCSICKAPYKGSAPGLVRYTPVDTQNTQWAEYTDGAGLHYKYQVLTLTDQLGPLYRAHGPMNVYYPSGCLHSTTPYIYGEVVGVASYYADNEHSTLLQTRPYVASKRHGTSYMYYEIVASQGQGQGSLYKILNYVGGKLHGESIVYNRNGIVIQEYNYANGHLDGLYKEYYDDGVLKLETVFQTGRRRYSNYYNKTGLFLKKVAYSN